MLIKHLQELTQKVYDVGPSVANEKVDMLLEEIVATVKAITDAAGADTPEAKVYEEQIKEMERLQLDSYSTYLKDK